jgi:hypothetical protein
MCEGVAEVMDEAREPNTAQRGTQCSRADDGELRFDSFGHCETFRSIAIVFDI